MTTRSATRKTQVPSLVRMSPSSFNEFLKAISAPASAVPEMVEVLNRVPPWEWPHSGRDLSG